MQKTDEQLKMDKLEGELLELEKNKKIVSDGLWYAKEGLKKIRISVSLYPYSKEVAELFGEFKRKIQTLEGALKKIEEEVKKHKFKHTK